MGFSAVIIYNAVMHMRALATAFLVVVLAGCGASSVRVRITQFDADHDPQPLTGARVRAVTLDAGTVPLPINSRTLAEMLTKQETVAVTNADGIARLKLLRDRSHLLELEGPLTFSEQDIPTARWVLTPESRLIPAADNADIDAHIVK